MGEEYQMSLTEAPKSEEYSRMDENELQPPLPYPDDINRKETTIAPATQKDFESTPKNPVTDNTPVVETVDSISTEQSEVKFPEDNVLGLYPLLEDVLSNPRFTYYPESDNFFEDGYGVGRLTREPFITEILKKLDLDTQKFRWLGEKIFNSGLRKNMLDTLGRNRQKESYYRIDLHYPKPNYIDEADENNEIRKYINETKKYALNFKNHVTTINSEED